ncbi:MAG: KR domain-containing protein, partial [Desulfobacteraceae bacterium]|nr:KR domain-containing protein [Desulfobacteraceae bacterium]
ALTESIKQSRPVDMVWGVAEGWWYFEDEEIRTETPLMEAEKWEQVMREIGLESVQGYPANQTRRSQADLALITAQEPQSSDSAKDRQKYTLAPSKASRAKTLEKLGSDVLPLCADITDPEQARSAIRQINEKFGDIHGIIHAYGTGKPDTFSKVRSALVLDVLFRGQNPDFLAFCSPTTGQDNLSDWAENAFLDAFACYRNTTNAAGIRTLSVNRNRWSPEGEARMTGKENPESFCRALFNGSWPQIIISPYDFRKADEFQVKNEEKRDAGQEPGESLSAQPRPDLGKTYASPGTETEKKLVSMWQEVLGIEQVGTNDNFFELGG